MALVGSPIGKPWGRRLPVSVGGFFGRSRAEFDAHVATLGTSTTAATDVSAGSRYFNYAADASVGYGSVWRPGFDQGLYNGAYDKLAAHAFPSSSVRTAQVGKRVFAVVIFSGISDAFPSSFARNGVTTSSGGPLPAYQCTQFLYYDDTTGPMQMDPNGGAGPNPYVW